MIDELEKLHVLHQPDRCGDKDGDTLRAVPGFRRASPRMIPALPPPIRIA